MDFSNDELRDVQMNAAEIIVEERLSFLQAYSNGLVPDPQDNTLPIELRAELRKEETETQIRINELNRLLKLMRSN